MTMVVDAHHHLRDPARRNYYWMSSELDPIRRPLVRFGVNALDAAESDAVFGGNAVSIYGLTAEA